MIDHFGPDQKLLTEWTGDFYLVQLDLFICERYGLQK